MQEIWDDTYIFFYFYFIIFFLEQPHSSVSLYILHSVQPIAAAEHHAEMHPTGWASARRGIRKQRLPLVAAPRAMFKGEHSIAQADFLKAKHDRRIHEHVGWKDFKW